MIYVIIGRSGSGKSSIEKAVCEKIPDLNRIVSDTTRLARQGEVHGVDYHFVTRDEFKRCLDDYVEYTVYNGWYYGINAKRINLVNDYVCVANPQGYHQLKNRYGNLVKGIVVHADGKERVLRYLQREENPNVYECCRRYLADEEDFSDIEQNMTLMHINNNEGDFEKAVEAVLDFIKNDLIQLWGSKQAS